MIKEISKNYKKFALSKGWTQQEAANQLGCSVQHVNRIFNDKCVPSAKLAAKMEEVMGKPQKSGLEDCIELYPLGSKFIQFIDGIEHTYSEDSLDKYCNKNYKEVIEELERQGYYIGLLNNGNYNILFYIPNYGFTLQEFCLLKITGYYTLDGYIFEPYAEINREEIFTRRDIEYQCNLLDNPYTVVQGDLSNLKEIIHQIFNNYNKIHNTNYIPCFCEEDYIKVLKEYN